MAGTADLYLPSLTLTATTKQKGLGDLTFPALTANATVDFGDAGVGALNLSLDSFNEFTGEYNFLGLGVTGEVGVTEETFPFFTLSSTTLYGDAGVGSIEIPLPILASDGEAGQYGTAAVDLPAFELDGGDAEAGALDVDLPGFTLSGVGQVGQAGSLASNFPNLTISATGVREGDNTADLTFPSLALASLGSQEGRGQGACQISLLTLQATGVAGEAGTSDLTFPVFTITSTGRGSYAGTASIILPAFVLEATLETDLASSLTSGVVDITVYTMNLSNFGVSTFTNYPFNSYCQFKGSYLGAKSDGIYLLSGTQDVATDIDVEMLKESIGQEVSNKKGIPVIYADLETDGQYDLTIKSEDQEQAYPGIPYHDGLRLQKIKIGRGLKGRYFGVGLKNRDGGSMRLNSLEIPVEISSTRKGR